MTVLEVLCSPFVAVQSVLRYESATPYAILYGDGSAGMLDRDAPPLIVTAIIAFAVVAVLWMRTRARIESQRIEALRELAARGQLSPQIVERHLQPPRLFGTLVLLLAWFGLFGGSALIVVALANNWWGDYGELGSAGIGVLVASLAVLSAPIALRELRRQSAA